jgi:hypothetical protein
MIRRAVPDRFDRLTGIGRTEPFRVVVRTNDEIEHDCVMKISKGRECSVEGLAFELLGALLASDLGLPTCEPFLVSLDEAFISTIPDTALKSRMENSSKIAFGSKHAGNQWRKWERMDRLVGSQLERALGVIAFDAFIANNDRRPRNSNLLVKDLEWRLIDHEGAFRFHMMISPKCEPWKAGNLELLRNYGGDSEHIFTRQLAKKHSELNFTVIGPLWEDLSDARIAQYDALLPEEWDSVRPNFDQAITHIKRVRDNIGLCIDELKRVLS